MASVAGEKSSGTAAMVLSKPASRGVFLLAKLLALSVTFALGTGLGVAAGYAYTGMLFTWLPPGGFVVLACALLLYLLSFASLTLLASTLMRSQLGAAGLAFGMALTLGLLGTLPAIAAYLPASLLGWGRAAASGATIELPWRAMLAVLALLPGMLLLGWAALRRQEI
jgi:ABC-2 type transport system permease protein